MRTDRFLWFFSSQRLDKMLFPCCLKAKCNLRLRYAFYEMKISTLLVLLQININVWVLYQLRLSMN